MPPTETTGLRDAELVERYLATREPPFFEELVRRHRARLVRLVFSILGPELSGDAEDVVQEALIQALDRLPGFRGESRFGTWLYRVAYNRALDHRRSAARRLRRAGRSLDGAPSNPPAGGNTNIGGAGSAADESLVERERDRALQAALATLPPPYPTVLRLFYWLDQPVAEIAETLGVAEGTVKSYLHRGRARLTRQLEEEGVGP